MLNFVFQLVSFFKINRVSHLNKNIVFYIHNYNLINFIKFLKLNEFLRFDLLVDICAVDLLTNKNRFEVIYSLLSLTYNKRIKIKMYLL